jgi:heptosyltransferase-2
MSRDAVASDPRPDTVVLHQWVGMGDLVWHIPYFRLIAATSRGGQIAVIAPPSTFARELMGHEPWVREIIDFDRHPRRHEGRQGRHRGVLGLLRMGAELEPRGFDRIILFTNHTNRALVAWRSGIAQRLGYGTSWLQRRLLTKSPWIERYRGPAVTAWHDASSFSIAQGWCQAPITPKLVVRPDALARMRERLAGLPRPLHAFAIGSSEPYKQWGEVNFAALANLVAARGHGVLLVGGPAEKAMAQAILERVEPALRNRVHAMTDGTVADTVAAMALVQVCVGNDTGAANIAAAVDTPSFVLLGPRPPLEHDPALLQMITAPAMADIRPADVAPRLFAAVAAVSAVAATAPTASPLAR